MNILAKQLAAATDIMGVFCVACGQPDTEALHDPARCPGRGGTLDVFPVADALAAYDRSFEEEPELDDTARMLHCAMMAAAIIAETKAAPSDHEIAIGEHAFKAGFTACSNWVEHGDGKNFSYAVEKAWNAYTPPEHLTGGGN